LTIGLGVLEKHFRHLMFLKNGGSTLGGVPQEEFVELGADLHSFSVHLDGIMTKTTDHVPGSVVEVILHKVRI
jgi:hypothetical protein